MLGFLLLLLWHYFGWLMIRDVIKFFKSWTNVCKSLSLLSLLHLVCTSTKSYFLLKNSLWRIGQTRIQVMIKFIKLYGLHYIMYMLLCVKYACMCVCTYLILCVVVTHAHTHTFARSMGRLRLASTYHRCSTWGWLVLKTSKAQTWVKARAWVEPIGIFVLNTN